jgi:hypothetical protein
MAGFVEYSDFAVIDLVVRFVSEVILVARLGNTDRQNCDESENVD